MKPNQIAISGCVVAALAILPVASEAAARGCIAQNPTATSFAWNSRQEANTIFPQIQADAWHARYHSEQLQSMVSRPDSVSWTSDAVQLEQIREAVNDIGRELCRLEAIRGTVSPWQQKTIDRISTGVRRLADNTRDALTFGDTHRETLWVPAFQRDVDNMYSEARKLTQAVGNAVEYRNVDRKDRNLRQELNTGSHS